MINRKSKCFFSKPVLFCPGIILAAVLLTGCILTGIPSGNAEARVEAFLSDLKNPSRRHLLRDEHIHADAANYENILVRYWDDFFPLYAGSCTNYVLENITFSPAAEVIYADLSADDPQPAINYDNNEITFYFKRNGFWDVKIIRITIDGYPDPLP